MLRYRFLVRITLFVNFFVVDFFEADIGFSQRVSSVISVCHETHPVQITLQFWSELPLTSPGENPYLTEENNRKNRGAGNKHLFKVIFKGLLYHF